MRYDLNGKTITIPDEFIEKNMRGLKLSKSEAINMFLADEGLQENPDQDALNAKAKLVGTSHREQADRKERKKPVRKPDDVKRALITAFAKSMDTDIEQIAAEVLNTTFDGTTIINGERMITFTLGNDKYEVTLTKKRPPKGE